MADKRVLGARARELLPQGANQRWSLNFLSNALADRRRCILAIVDLNAEVPGNGWDDPSLPGVRLVRELDALIIPRPACHDPPKRHGADNHGAMSQ